MEQLYNSNYLNASLNDEGFSSVESYDNTFKNKRDFSQIFNDEQSFDFGKNV